VIVRIRWQPRKSAFVYPIPVEPPPRTAVLAPFFRSRGSVRVFPGGWNDGVRKFAPEAIAGTLGQLETLTGTHIPSLSRAVIVLERRGDSWLTDARRERLWDAFRVPVFEQVIADNGELLAADCEAHEGLHIESPRLRVGKEHIDASPCACGRKTPRLIPTEQAGLVRHAAAAAR
jgi:hypothetical protein